MASERYTGVWRSGTGGEVWWVNQSFSDFNQKNADLFNQGWRITDLDSNGGYSAVWHPGTDGQVVLVGISRDDFLREVLDRFHDGLRVQSLRVGEDGRFAVVWRSGSGPQEVHAYDSAAKLLAADGPFFDEGLRIQTFQQDGRGVYWGVWRADLGTGGQWVERGLTEAQFADADRTQIADGNRLTQITSIDGITGIWRSGSDGARWALELPLSDFSTFRDQQFTAGLRMVSLGTGFV